MGDDSNRKREPASGQPAEVEAGEERAGSVERGAERPNGDTAATAVELGEAARLDRASELEAELARLKDQLMRALAETENTRKRTQRERDEAVRYAAAGLAADVLNVADDLRRALESVSEEALQGDERLRALHAGVELVERQLLAGFQKHGIRKIEPVGDVFNPDFHQAMFEVAAPGKAPGTVVQLLQAGYVMGDRLLRPAFVAVAKGADSPQAVAPAPGLPKGNGKPIIDTTA